MGMIGVSCSTHIGGSFAMVSLGAWFSCFRLLGENVDTKYKI